MSIRENQGKVVDHIPVQTVLASVFDKTHLKGFMRGLVGMNPNMLILSTGGTYKILKEYFPNNVQTVEQYTGYPEMDGGLVKTLHPMIHAGILAERGNKKHNEDLKKMKAHHIDMVVGNFYDFEKATSVKNATFETARGHIDIGGPTMITGALKNFLGTAPVTNPQNYGLILENMRENDGHTTLELRAGLAKEAMKGVANYRNSINEYLEDKTARQIASLYLNQQGSN